MSRKLRGTCYGNLFLGFVLLTASSFASAEDFTWTIDGDHGVATLKKGDQPVVAYQFGYDTSTPEKIHDTYKVFHHVYGPGSQTLVTKGPGGHFTHHRGLFLGWNQTSWEGGAADFWHCTKGAHQRHHKIVTQEADADHGSMTTEIHWNDASGKPVIREFRTVSVREFPTESAPGYGWQIDWSSRLESERGEITLEGDRQHAGFQVRAAQEVAETNNARYRRPAQFPQQPFAVQVDDRLQPDEHINLNWLAMTCEIGEKPYCFEYFEDPALPKPSRYSERPYGRFGAFFSTVLTPAKPLDLKYRILVSTERDLTPQVIQERYDRFVMEAKR